MDIYTHSFCTLSGGGFASWGLPYVSHHCITQLRHALIVHAPNYQGKSLHGLLSVSCYIGEEGTPRDTGGFFQGEPRQFACWGSG